ncbi:MAG: hypothetical protein JRD93_21355 [Deltaproteobacteria bacterium]|nr:hypothetical protein [Deltaproteobacteria bacterium]
MKELIHWLLANKEWLFSGIGIAVVGVIINISSDKIQKKEKLFTPAFLDWIKTNSQWLFSGIGAFAIGLIVSIAANIYVDKIEIVNQQRLKDETYNEQIQALNDVEKSLNNLVDFVGRQKHKLRESEDILNALKKEHDTLKPVIETEREIIQKIFAIQSKRYMDNIWKERVVSFFVGVLASVIASFLYGLFQRFYKENEKS